MSTTSTTTAPLAVSHHDDDKLALAVDLATALLADPRAAGTGMDRHWLRGPHLRLWPAPDADPGVVADIARDVLRRHRSTARLDAATVEASGRALGRAELVPGPYGPLRADNTVEEDPRAGEVVTALVGAAAADLKRQVLAALLPAVAASGPLAALPPAVRMIGPMVVLTARWPVAGVRSGYLTFRSHLEDHLALHDRDARLLAAYVDRLRCNRCAITRLVTDALGQIETSADDAGAPLRRGGYLGPDPALRAWSGAVAAAMTAAGAGVRAGVVGEDLGPGYVRTARAHFTGDVARWTFGDDRPYSDFHRTLRSLTGLPERAHVEDFATYRFVVNQFLRTTSLLDVAPVERYFASYALATVVEAELGTTWQDLLERGRVSTAPTSTERAAVTR